MQKPTSLLNPWAICGLSLSLAIGFCLVAARFYNIQILEHAIWVKKAQNQQQMKIDLGAKRGTIYAGGADAVALAQDVPSFHLYVDAQSIPLKYKQPLAVWLAPLLHKSIDALVAELNKTSRFRKLEWHLDSSQKEQIEKGFKKFIKNKPIPKNALFFLSGYKRVYPLGSLAGSLLHTLGTQEGVHGPERVATGGLEKRFDLFLKGTPGQLVGYRTPKGRLEGTRVAKKEHNGADLYLTLHPLIQILVEKELEAAVKKARAKGGWAIMMHPFTGELLALAQVPSLDLLDPAKLLDDPLQRTYANLKALTDPYEPGSIMKPLTMLTCLKANRVLESLHKPAVFNPEEKIACIDGRFPGRKNPIKDVHAYRYLNMDMALQKSSNIYMARSIAKVQAALGDSFYASELKNSFGFGRKTTLAIGAESSGFVPTPHKKTAKGFLEWSMPTPFSLAMGYNILATSMQMSRVFCMIANGGYEVEPVLVKKLVKKNDQGPDEVLYDHSTLLNRPKRVIPFEDIERLKQAMQFSTNKGGTASRAKIPGYSACGKTATTEKLVDGHYCKDRHISTFVGFAPMEKPEFVLLIAIDEPEKFYTPGVGKNQFGGVCAAPSFSVIGQKTLEILGVTPDDPAQDFSSSKIYNSWKRLDELFKSWNH